MKTTTHAIEIARLHATGGAVMQSSAVLCLADAERLMATGDLTSAKARALKSLAYSVGILSPEYAAAVSA